MEEDLSGLFSKVLGAKFAADFVRQAWEAASPEAKQSLADALVARMSKDADRNFAVSSAIEGVLAEHARQAAKAYLAERGAELDAAVRAKVDREWAGGIERVARDLLNEALRQVKAKVSW
jgi:hypothetical protein